MQWRYGREKIRLLQIHLYLCKDGSYAYQCDDGTWPTWELIVSGSHDRSELYPSRNTVDYRDMDVYVGKLIAVCTG
jgi:hypothetical protein